jgi:hypothetical protein
MNIRRASWSFSMRETYVILAIPERLILTKSFETSTPATLCSVPLRNAGADSFTPMTRI